jgi:hypothetical protein
MTKDQMESWIRVMNTKEMMDSTTRPMLCILMLIAERENEKAIAIYFDVVTAIAIKVTYNSNNIETGYFLVPKGVLSNDSFSKEYPPLPSISALPKVKDWDKGCSFGGFPLSSCSSGTDVQA